MYGNRGIGRTTNLIKEAIKGEKIMILNCRSCIHTNVCKYKEKYASFANALENIVIKEPIPGENGKDQQYTHSSVKEYEVFIDLRPTCKFYKKSEY